MVEITDSVGIMVIKRRDNVEKEVKIEDAVKSRAIDYRYGQTHRKK